MSLDPARLPLHPPAPDRCRPPVRVDAEGRRVPDPCALLGLDPTERDPERIRAAWREAMIQVSAEQDPAGALALRAARDLLLDPAQLDARELGVLHAPDPARWGLPLPAAHGRTLSQEARLLGQLALYAMLEEELWSHGLGQRYEDAIAELRGAGG
jgi:hypothetical protein